MQNRSNLALLVLVVVVLAVGGYWYLNNQEDDSSKTVFRIGSEDNDWKDLAGAIYDGIDEYSCEIGVDNVNETFPNYLYVSAELAGGLADEGVAHVEITFTLDRKYSNVVFRLVRSGSETSVVTIDSDQEYLVTAATIGSRDGWTVGAYNLEIGELDEGRHMIELTVADDGEGDGGYSWDTLALFTAPP